MNGTVAAVDLGATSGRVMLGHVGPDELRLQHVLRFPNGPVETADGLHWNVDELYRSVLAGLRAALRDEPDIRSVGVDSWAVDYALLRGDRVVSTPFHYRDERTARGVEAVGQVIAAPALYAANGLQFLPFNTLYQLAVDRDEGLLDASTGLLLVPDLHARVSLFDRFNSALIHLGDDKEWTAQVKDQQRNIRGDPKKWLPGRFVHPHDACFDAKGNIFVVEWVTTGRVTMLKKLA